MSLSTVKDTVRTWIENVLGIEVIFGFPSAPRPSSQYAMVNIISDNDLSEPQTQKIFIPANQTVDIDYSVLSNAFLSINIYKPTALDSARLLVSSLALTVNIELFNSANLGVGSISEIRNLHEEINTVWEERGQFDLNIYHSSNISENIETIQTIELTNELSGDVIEVTKP